MKHAFRREKRTHLHAIKATHQLGIPIHLEAVRMTEIMQCYVSAPHILRNPRAFNTIGTTVNHAGKIPIRADEKRFALQTPTQAPGNVQVLQLQNGSWFRRPPQDG